MAIRKLSSTFVSCLICFFSILLPQTSFAKPATEDMKEFNKRCPAPNDCQRLAELKDDCRHKKSSACRDFVRVYKKLLPEYDCQRPVDVQDGKREIVPAIWLCENHESALEFLSRLETKEGLQLFHSEALRETLEGPLAERFMDLSRGDAGNAVKKETNASSTKPEEKRSK